MGMLETSSSAGSAVGNGFVVAIGVGVAEDSVEVERSSSSRGGGGRVRSERSGRGLEGSRDVGVTAERWGGQSGSGGNWGIFSLRASVLSLSFSLVKPMRLKKAFMAHKRRARREEDEGRSWENVDTRPTEGGGEVQ